MGERIVKMPRLVLGEGWDDLEARARAGVAEWPIGLELEHPEAGWMRLAVNASRRPGELGLVSADIAVGETRLGKGLAFCQSSGRYSVHVDHPARGSVSLMGNALAHDLESALCLMACAALSLWEVSA